jgi:dCTP deaminase
MEVFNLPPNIAGFGFPPSSVSAGGILMTNPGHVDPGYVGRLSFTLVNMGKKGFELAVGKAICTVLFFELSQNPAADWTQRGNIASTPTYRQQLLSKLCSEFMDISDRARSEAEKAYNSVQARAALLPLLVAIFSVAATYFATNHQTQVQLQKVEGHLSRLEDRINVNERINTIDARLERIYNPNLDDRLRDMDNRLRTFDTRLDIDRGLTTIEERMQSLESSGDR